MQLEKIFIIQITVHNQGKTVQELKMGNPESASEPESLEEHYWPAPGPTYTSIKNKRNISFVL